MLLLCYPPQLGLQGNSNEDHRFNRRPSEMRARVSVSLPAGHIRISVRSHTACPTHAFKRRMSYMCLYFCSTFLAHLPIPNAHRCVESSDLLGTRLPVDHGCVGVCFKTKKLLNISNPYADKRFASDIDKKVESDGHMSRFPTCTQFTTLSRCRPGNYPVVLITKAGFTTQSLLCAPVSAPDGEMMAVVEVTDTCIHPCMNVQLAGTCMSQTQHETWSVNHVSLVHS